MGIAAQALLLEIPADKHGNPGRNLSQHAFQRLSGFQPRHAHVAGVVYLFTGRGAGAWDFTLLEHHRTSPSA